MVACSEALTSLAFVTRRSRIWTYRTKTLRSSPGHAPNRARSPARGPGERVATLRQAPSCQGRVVLAQAEPWASAAAGHAFVVPYGTLLPVSRATRADEPTLTPYRGGTMPPRKRTPTGATHSYARVGRTRRGRLEYLADLAQASLLPLACRATRQSQSRPADPRK